MTPPFRIRALLVEDNAADARLLRELLRDAPGHGVELVCVERLSDAVEQLGAARFDVVLLDLSLPDSTGTQGVTRINATAPNTPIVVLTGMADEDVALTAMRTGAEDYLVKGQVDGRLLLRAIRYAIERARAETERAARREAEATAARLQLLAEASRHLGSSLEYEATIARVAQLVVPALADACLIDVSEDDELRRHAAASTAPLGLEAFEPAGKSAEHPIARAITTGRTTSLSGDELGGMSQAAPEVTSMLCVPLGARGRTVGVLTLVARSPRPPFGAQDIALAEDLANRIALAIDNARLYRAREDVLGVVSHDLRNPLNLVLIAAATLHRLVGTKEPNAVKMLRRIELAVADMTRLVNDLLDVTRMDAGRLALKLSEVEVDDLVREAVERMQPLAAEHGVHVEAGVHDRLAVLADRERAMQVFSNLLGNAIKFSPPGGRVVIGADGTADGARIRIVDSGPGLRREEAQRVFDRFWRGRDSRDGAGLGLAIAKAIVHAHGGRIWVESRLGFGSTFYFTLPAPPSAAVAAPPATAREASPD